MLRRSIKYTIADTEEMYIESENKILNKELKPNYQGLYYGDMIKINSAGFRDYEYSFLKEKSTYRIVLLGDSMTFGPAVAMEDLYPKVLERLLNERASSRAWDVQKIEVLNFSVPGYNTIQEYEYLRTKIISYEPDLIILNFFMNDVVALNGQVSSHIKSLTSVARSGLCNKIMNTFYCIGSKSYFAQYLLSHVAVLARRAGVRQGYISDFKGAYDDENENWQECRKFLLKTKKIAKDNNASFMVVIIPFLSDLNDSHPLKKEIAIINNFCLANGIDALNLFPYFYGYKAQSLWINPINGHPNATACAVMAGAVNKYIVEKNYIHER